MVRYFDAKFVHSSAQLRSATAHISVFHLKHDQYFSKIQGMETFYSFTFTLLHYYYIHTQAKYSLQRTLGYSSLL